MCVKLDLKIQGVLKKPFLITVSFEYLWKLSVLDGDDVGKLEALLGYKPEGFENKIRKLTKDRKFRKMLKKKR